MTRSTGPVEVLVELDRGGDLTLHEQLERSLRDAVRAGRLQAGAPLPSSRALAVELGVSRGVVTAAYDQLTAEGYLETRQGAPVRVARGVRHDRSAYGEGTAARVLKRGSRWGAGSLYTDLPAPL